MIFTSKVFIKLSKIKDSTFLHNKMKDQRLRDYILKKL